MGHDNNVDSWHTPVMADEVKNLLITNPDGVYIDGTIGGGGHAGRILESLSSKALYVGIDKDATAVERCKKRFTDSPTPTKVFQGNFAMMTGIADRLGIEGVDGVLFDLGVSSAQIDKPERGFSFSSDGPLDMRMDQGSGFPAHELLNSLTERELADLIYEYGEERHSRKIASAIVQAHRISPVNTTSELASIVERVIMGKMKTKSLARVFQALRIAVNDELTSLSDGLVSAVDLLRKGGRIVVLSYHSLEDRIVKRFFREQATDYIYDPAAPVDQPAGTRRLKILTKKVMRPSDSEVKNNPRSRSARLRAAERI